MRRHLAVTAASAVAVVALAGCGGDPDDTDGGPTPGPDTSPAATETTSSPAEPAAYLPTPDGRELTEPGTDLELREPALAAWRPRQDVVGVVGVSVLRIERTTVKRSLVGFEIDPALKSATPYFVTVEVGNGGDTDLGGRQLPLYVVDSDERLIPPTGIDPAFERCPGSTLPAIFAPGDETRSCLIFLVPQGAELELVMFRPPEGVVPITWTGKVQDLADRGKNAPGGDKGKRKKGRGPR